jgi:glycosyltransferase involved in cell wall biosynthesis
MSPRLTVAVCTHNPRREHLRRTLEGLRRQLSGEAAPTWELIVVDNASSPPVAESIDLSWHPAARIVREERLGLTHARLRSFHEASGEILVYVDDDNVLEAHYLRIALEALDADSSLGAIGGRVIAEFESPPPGWFAGLGLDLGCRDLGNRDQSASWVGHPPAARAFPTCAPIGAGMVIRRAAYADYVTAVETDPVRQALGRRGADLSSGEDNDMVMSLLVEGWRVAYLPRLRLKHLIPAARLTRDYLGRYARSSNRTWVQVLDVHGLRPWTPLAPWTIPLRKARALARSRPWRGDADFVRWCGACGLLEGRALLARTSKR